MAGVALGDIHPSFCVAGVALGDIHLHFVWQAWHLTTSIVTLRGRCGTYGTGLALVARLVIRWRRGAAAFCVAGVALCDIHLHFVWQAWRLTTSIVTLRGRRGTGTGLALVARLVIRWRRGAAAFCVAGVALRDIHLHFVWQAWHLTTSIVTCVALMALGWLWWRAWSPGGAVAPRRFAAGVALGDIHLHFVWQAWHLTTSIVTLRGRRGTYGTGLALVARLVIRWRRGAAAFCVAGVALRDIHLHFVWQAWHLATSIVTLRGRRGTGTGLALVARLVTRWRRGAEAFCVAGVALRDIHLRFVASVALDGLLLCWQAWHTCHHTTCHHTTCHHTTCHHTTCPHTTCSHTQLVITPFARTQLVHTQLVHTQLAHTQLVLTQLVLTCSHTTCPHMAGVGLGDIHPSFCAAGVALGDIHPSLCVVGVALMALGWLWRAWSSGGAVAPRRFAWQA